MARWIAAALHCSWLVSKKLAFPFVAVPMGVFSLSLTLVCCWFLVTYVVCCISWWTLLKVLRSATRQVTGAPPRRADKAAAPALPASLRQLSDVNIPRRYAQPLRRPSLSTSRDCLVGDGTDRDFEGLGGWALSTDDDEALYMARTFGQEPCFEDVTLSSPRYRRSASQSSGFLPSGPTSPALTRPSTAHDEKGFAGVAHHSRSSSPGAYFSLSHNRSSASLPRLRQGPPVVPEHRRSNSNALNLTNVVQEFRDAPTPFYDHRTE